MQIHFVKFTSTYYHVILIIVHLNLNYIANQHKLLQRTQTLKKKENIFILLFNQ